MPIEYFISNFQPNPRHQLHYQYRNIKFSYLGKVFHLHLYLQHSLFLILKIFPSFQLLQNLLSIIFLLIFPITHFFHLMFHCMANTEVHFHLCCLLTLFLLFQYLLFFTCFLYKNIKYL